VEETPDPSFDVPKRAHPTQEFVALNTATPINFGSELFKPRPSQQVPKFSESCVESVLHRAPAVSRVSSIHIEDMKEELETFQDTMNMVNINYPDEVPNKNIMF
jgi:hypothetical protein